MPVFSLFAAMVLISILTLMFVASSFMVLRHQRVRYQVKRRLALVTMSEVRQPSPSHLFHWEQQRGWLLSGWHRVQLRLDALFGRRGKKLCLLGMLVNSVPVKSLERWLRWKVMAKRWASLRACWMSLSDSDFLSM